VAGFDVAAFVIHDRDRRQIFGSHVALDLRVPEVGEQVAVLANNINKELLDVDETEPWLFRGKLTQKFEVRLGYVTEVVMERVSSTQSFIFRTSIPVTPGMSGAPVITNPPGGVLTVRGVVSSGLGGDEAITSFMLPGCSAMSVLWPAMGLALPITVRPREPFHHFLGDLLESGILVDVSDQVRVRVKVVNGLSEVTYLDHRKQTQLRLTMACHPGRL
jgi:hypothetical protein